MVANFKQTNDMESKNNFVSILFFLTSIQSPEIDRNQFIKGNSRSFILDFLRNNFSVESNACASGIKTRYVSNYQYGTTSGLSPSPSAGKVFDVSMSKESYLHIESKEKCDLALSSMIPYANLNGNGYNITNFIRAYYKQPLFGSMLEIAVKSLLLTNNKGDEALTKFIDESIKLENEAREGKNGFWDKVWNGLEWFTLEGIASNIVYDGKFCNHNLCSSSLGGSESPSSWEGVAQMLADNGKINLLNKAIDQCRIVSTRNFSQHMECQGIYPFLFGTLIARPELANRIAPIKPFRETPGQEMDFDGRSNYVTPEQAERNVKLNQKYDITNKHTQGEWIAALLTVPTYEELHPLDVLRMNNLVADSTILNPKGSFRHYDEGSDWYRKKLLGYNARLVILPLASYRDFLISIIAIKDLLRFGFSLANKVITYAKTNKILYLLKLISKSSKTFLYISG